MDRYGIINLSDSWKHDTDGCIAHYRRWVWSFQGDVLIIAVCTHVIPINECTQSENSFHYAYSIFPCFTNYMCIFN